MEQNTRNLDIHNRKVDNHIFFAELIVHTRLQRLCCRSWACSSLVIAGTVHVNPARPKLVSQRHTQFAEPVLENGRVEVAVVVCSLALELGLPHDDRSVDKAPNHSVSISVYNARCHNTEPTE